MAVAVYLATEAGPAADLSAGLREAADAIRPLAEQARRVPELEAESDARRRALLVKSDECRTEWIRAEQAEAALTAAREENERLHATLGEIIDYRGAADSALGDPYVMDRARAALAQERP